MHVGVFGTHRTLTYVCGLCPPRAKRQFTTAEEKARHLEHKHAAIIRAEPSGGYRYLAP